MKRKLNINFLRLHALEILVLACIILSTSITFAAYTNQSYKKGVVTTNGSQVCFSSNYLTQCDIGIAAAQYGTSTITVSKQENPASGAAATAELTVSNHAPDDATIINQKDIKYDITFTLEGLNGNTPVYSNYFINGTAFTSDIYKISDQEIKGGSPETISYKITFPYADIGKVSLTVTAVPNGNTVANVNSKMLARKLFTAVYTEGNANAFSWLAKLSDRGGKPPKDYHAYNFEVSGTAGKGTVTIGWNTEFVEIDQLFLDEMKIKEGSTYTAATETDKKATLAFAVDTKEESYYLIQFYRTKAAGDETWDDVYKSIDDKTTYITFAAASQTAATS